MLCSESFGVLQLCLWIERELELADIPWLFVKMYSGFSFCRFESFCFVTCKQALLAWSVIPLEYLDLLNLNLCFFLIVYFLSFYFEFMGFFFWRLVLLKIFSCWFWSFILFSTGFVFQLLFEFLGWEFYCRFQFF